MLGEVRHQLTKTPASDWRDIPRIYAALDQDSPSHLCLRFKILTLVRSAGVRGAQFDEIEDGVWTVPAGCMKGTVDTIQDFRVPLSKPALEILDRAEKWRRGPFMFPGGKTGGKLGGISDVAIGKVFKKIDPNGTPHGLRTSFRTWVQDTDAAHYDVAEAVLAHIIGGKVDRSYARSDLLDRRRVLMQAWADFVTEVEAKVVPIRGRSSK